MINKKQIPKVIWQTHEYDFNKLPNYMRALTDSWQEHNPDFYYRYVSGKERLEFIKDNFEEKWFALYSNCLSNIFKADIWKLLILFKFGGVYADVDTMCLSSINKSIDLSKDFVCEGGFGRAYGWINNSIMASKPEGDFITFWKNNVQKNMYENPLLQPNETFGPLSLSNAMDIYMQDKQIHDVQISDFNFPYSEGEHSPRKEMVLQISGSTLWNDIYSGVGNSEFDFSYFNDLYLDKIKQNDLQIKLIRSDGHGGYNMKSG